MVYYALGRFDIGGQPGIVANLFVVDGRPLPKGIVFVRAIYFSIETMTTLGFGDMYANPHSVAGYVILSIQVLMGYVLLGVLVTRFAVLFTGGGPGKRRSKAGRKRAADEVEE
jgi:hypothetical protein